MSLPESQRYLIEIIVGPCAPAKAKDCCLEIQGYLDSFFPALDAAVALIGPEDPVNVSPEDQRWREVMLDTRKDP